jgi:Skp family chaperone for outer membrane proteins
MVIWLAFAMSLAAVIAATVDVVVRGVRLWRQAKAAGAEFGQEIDRVSKSAEEIQTHLDAADAAAERLRVSGERLRRSRARLEVQVQALREAQATLERLRRFMPSR